jgi:hypothetical protein
VAKIMAPPVGQIGWSASPVSMGDHNDYCMVSAGGDKPIAGVCHASAENAARRTASSGAVAALYYSAE